MPEYASCHLNTSICNVWQADYKKSEEVKTKNQKLYTYLLYFTDDLYYGDATDQSATDQGSSGNFEKDLLMFLTRRRNRVARPGSLKAPEKRRASISASNLSQAAGVDAFETALAQHLEGKLSESKLRSTMKAPKEIFLENWVLAELAIMKNKTSRAQKYLATCIATYAFTDPIYLMVRLRRQALAEGN